MNLLFGQIVSPHTFVDEFLSYFREVIVPFLNTQKEKQRNFVSGGIALVCVANTEPTRKKLFCRSIFEFGDISHTRDCSERKVQIWSNTKKQKQIPARSCRRSRTWRAGRCACPRTRWRRCCRVGSQPESGMSGCCPKTAGKASAVALQSVAERYVVPPQEHLITHSQIQGLTIFLVLCTNTYIIPSSTHLRVSASVPHNFFSGETQTERVQFFALWQRDIFVLHHRMDTKRHNTFLQNKHRFHRPCM